MTVTYQATSIISSSNSVPIFSMAASDILYVAPNTNIVSNGYYAIASSSGATGGPTIENAGQIVGYYSAISISATNPYPRATILNEASGFITSGTGNDAIYVSGAAHYITNYGTIASAPYGNFAIATYSQGAIWNYGAIIGGIGNDDGNAADFVYTYNAGTIGAGSYNGNPSTAIAYDGFQGSTSVEQVVNDGTMNGQVEFNDGAGDQLFNTGRIYGNVSFGSGVGDSGVNSGLIQGNVFIGSNSGDVFDSSYGTVTGTITTGAAGAVVTGGQTGGTIMGGAGNDVLIANQTQTAANNAAHATLYGSGGINALYGDGAYTMFMSGDANGGYNQIWGGASQMTGVAGYTNNTLSFANAPAGVFVDLLNGHDAYVGSTAGGAWAGTGIYEDSIIHVPNVIGSAFGDVIQADSGIDSITGGGKADQLYAGSGAASQDTFVYTGYSDSNTVTGYDTIVGFKIGADKIDLSALHTDGSHLAISTAGTSNTLYIEQTAGTFNAATDLAMIVNTSTAGGLHASDFVF